MPGCVALAFVFSLALFVLPIRVDVLHAPQLAGLAGAVGGELVLLVDDADAPVDVVLGFFALFRIGLARADRAAQGRAGNLGAGVSQPFVRRATGAQTSGGRLAHDLGELERALLFIGRFAPGGVSSQTPLCDLPRLIAQAEYLRQIEVGIVQEAIVRAFGEA